MSGPYNAIDVEPDDVPKFIREGMPFEEPDDTGPIENELKPTTEQEAARILPGRVRFMPWLEMRHRLGKLGDRRKWLQFLTATTSYSPFQWQTRGHIACSMTSTLRSNKLVVAGIRTGKTIWAGAEGAMLDTANPGINSCVIAPTYDQVRENLLPAWMNLVTEMASNGYPLMRRMNWSLMRADLHCGARIFFRSADKVQNLRGFEFGSVRFDESDYARNPMDALDTLIGRLSSPKAYERELVCTTTPYEYAGSVIQHWDLQRSRAFAPDVSPEEANAILRAWWFGRARTLDNPTLPPDFLAGIASYSLPQYLKEIEGYPAIHRGAKIFDGYGAAHIYPGSVDRRLPYDLAIDWGQHRPSYLWVQPIDGGRAVIFDEFHPEDMPPERQLQEVQSRCRGLGSEPIHAAVDRADPDQIEAFRKRFRSTRVLDCDSRELQSRKASVGAMQRLIEPLDGVPKLLVAKHLTMPTASARGIHAVLGGIMWEWDRLHNCYGDVADKDGKLDHCWDAAAYWAKLVGDDRMRAATVRPMTRAGTIAHGLGLKVPGMR